MVKKLQSIKPTSELYQREVVVLKKENNPRYYNDIVNELLLILTTTRGSLAPKQTAAVLLKMKKTGVLSPHFLGVYYFFQVERTATRMRIVEEMDFAQGVVYKMVDKLLALGYIKKAGTVATHAKGGHRPTLYAMIDATPNEIAEARVKEEERRIPGMVLCKKITQFLLHEWIPGTPNPKEITLTTMKRIVTYNFDITQYHRGTMFEQIARQVQTEGGIKVWR